MSSTLNKARLSEIFEAIDDRSDRLTTWEQNFVASVQEQWENGRTLSDKQLEILERIYLKV